jgi:hypothetical protein
MFFSWTVESISTSFSWISLLSNRSMESLRILSMPSLSQALPEPDQLGGVKGPVMFKMNLCTEILPVWIFIPPVHDAFVTLFEHPFQQDHTGYLTDGYRKSSIIRTVINREILSSSSQLIFSASWHNSCSLSMN